MDGTAGAQSGRRGGDIVTSEQDQTPAPSGLETGPHTQRRENSTFHTVRPHTHAAHTTDMPTPAHIATHVSFNGK